MNTEAYKRKEEYSFSVLFGFTFQDVLVYKICFKTSQIAKASEIYTWNCGIENIVYCFTAFYFIKLASVMNDYNPDRISYACQKFGGISVTGEIDEETKKLMKARRCGLPDQPDSRFAKTRHKRFTIHGQQWPYRNLTWRWVFKIINNTSLYK